jgi:hypothetical protein
MGGKERRQRAQGRTLSTCGRPCSQLQCTTGARGDCRWSLPRREALAEHDADERVAVVDVRVLVIARGKHDAVLVLRREVVALEEEERLVSSLDVLGDGRRQLLAVEESLVDHRVDRASRRGDAIARVFDVAHVCVLSRPCVADRLLECRPIEQQARAAMHVAVLLPHTRAGPATLKSAVLAAPISVVREAEHTHPIARRLQLSVDLLDRAIGVRRVATPRDAREDVLVLDGIAHESVRAQPQPARRQDVLEDGRGGRVVRKQPLRFRERVRGAWGVVLGWLNHEPRPGSSLSSSRFSRIPREPDRVGDAHDFRRRLGSLSTGAA